MDNSGKISDNNCVYERVGAFKAFLIFFKVLNSLDASVAKKLAKIPPFWWENSSSFVKMPNLVSVMFFLQNGYLDQKARWQLNFVWHKKGKSESQHYVD